MSQLSSLENEVLDLHRRLAEAEQRAAVAERIAAEEIAAKKAKSELGDKLAQAARTERAENTALIQQVSELKQEIGALKDKPAATTAKSKAKSTAKSKAKSTAKPKAKSTAKPKRRKARSKSGASPESPQSAHTIPQSGTGDPAPLDQAETGENTQTADDPLKYQPAEAPLAPEIRSPDRRGGHLTLVLAVFAAVLGWSLVIFGVPDSEAPMAPPPEILPQKTAEANTEAPPQITKTEPSPPPVQAPPVQAPPVQESASEVAPAEAAPPPIVSDLQTRSLQNERIEQSIKAAKRAEKQRAELQQRMEILRKRLSETEAKLLAAELQANTARRQTVRANAALAEANTQNKRMLDANTDSHFQTEAKLMAEIDALRKALADATRITTTTGTEAE